MIGVDPLDAVGDGQLCNQEPEDAVVLFEPEGHTYVALGIRVDQDSAVAAAAELLCHRDGESGLSYSALVVVERERDHGVSS